MRNPMDLTGRTILVTGASSGIGRETAILLSELGASVVLAARNIERLHQTLEMMRPGEHKAEVTDFTAIDELSGWLKNITAVSGPLAGIVHSAGIHPGPSPVRFLKSRTLDEVLLANVCSSVALAKAYCQKGCHAEGGGSCFCPPYALLREHRACLPMQLANPL